MNAFVHKPKGYLSTIIDRTEFKFAWDSAKAQDWYEKRAIGEEGFIGYVGTDGEFHYFQRRGTTTGFARVPVSPDFKYED